MRTEEKCCEARTKGYCSIIHVGDERDEIRPCLLQDRKKIMAFDISTLHGKNVDRVETPRMFKNGMTECHAGPVEIYR